MTRVGLSTVRIVGVNVREGVAFVAVGVGPDVRVRWSLSPLRWRCDAHRGVQGCTHTKAVSAALANREMRNPDDAA